MAIRSDLKRKLKATDKRRRRRTVATGHPLPTQVKTCDVDVMGLLVQAIIVCAGTDRHFVDAAAVAALRSCLTGNQPTGTQSRKLFAELQTVVTREDINTRSARKAIEDLLSLAMEHQDKHSDSTSFLSYLSLLAS